MLGQLTKSYLAFPCTNCNLPITAFSILAEIPTPEITSQKAIELSCPSCGHVDGYHLNDVRRFEKHQIH